MTNHELIIDFINGARRYDGANHLGYQDNTLINYSTVLCTIDRKNKVASVNTRKYSRTTSKIQSMLLRELDNNGFRVDKYDGGGCYYWNFGYQGAPTVKRSDFKVGGVA